MECWEWEREREREREREIVWEITFSPASIERMCVLLLTQHVTQASKYDNDDNFTQVEKEKKMIISVK